MILDAKGNPIKKRFFEIATRNTAAGSFVTGLSQLPNPSLLLQDMGKTIEVYDRVARQVDIAAAMQDYRAGISTMDYIIDSSNLDSERVKWFSGYLDSLDVPEIIEQSLSARDYGYAVLEIVEWKQYKGKTVPSRLELKPAKWFGYDIEGNLRFYTKKKPQEGENVHKRYPNKFINPRHKATYENPYGIALLDLAYWHAVGLNGNYEFMMTFLEEDSRDKWIVKHPRNATSQEIDHALSMAYNLRNNAVAAIPEGNEFEKKDVAGRASSTELYTLADELLTSKIVKLWFGTDLLMQRDGKGGYSSSQSGVEIRGDALSGGKRIAAYTFNELFRICDELNNIPGAEDETISFKLYNKTETTKDDAEKDSRYIDRGMKPTAKFYVNRGYQSDEFTLDGTQNQNTSPRISESNNESEADTTGINN